MSDSTDPHQPTATADPESTDPDPDASTVPATGTTPTHRDVSQFLGVFVVISGVVLIALSSAGWVEFDDSTARLLLLFGSVLVLGREAAGRLA